jgi:hypothetical protein
MIAHLIMVELAVIATTALFLVGLKNPFLARQSYSPAWV